jgi:excisionase family DNA binding protein
MRSTLRPARRHVNLSDMKTVQMRTDHPSPNPDDWTTISGAARMLYVSERTVHRMIEDGRLRAYEFHACPGSRFLWAPQVQQLATGRAIGRCA